MYRQSNTNRYYSQSRFARQHKRRFSLRRTGILIFVLLAASLLLMVWRDSSGVDSNGKQPAIKKVLSAIGSDRKEEAINQSNAALQNIFQAWTASHPQQQWGLYVEDLKEGSHKAELNSNLQLGIASLYKLFLLEQLPKTIPAGQWATTTIGGYSYQQCITRMIQYSDNACAEAIAGRIGWRKLQSQIEASGYVATNVIQIGVKGSAQETAAVLKKIYHGENFSDLARSLALEGMKKQKFNEGIPKACLSCTIYNKTGDFAGYLSDGAIIETGDRVYLLVIISKAGTFPLIAELATQVHQEMAKPLP